ncbi:MAG: DUF2877 domain-containing protein [Alphaproteobacteria bacterium]
MAGRMAGSRALHWGGAARAVLDARSARTGRVHSVFARSFYVETEAGLACLGTLSLHNGPRNLIFAEPSGHALAMPRAGDALRRAATVLHIGATLAIELAGVIDWNPGPPPAFDAARIRSALDRLARVSLPDLGLAPLIAVTCQDSALGPRPGGMLCARAQPMLAALGRWASPGGTTAPDEALGLIGLGPGLTPAGDDALGGAMIAARQFGFDVIADRLAAAVLVHARRKTNTISLAHLDSAASGEGADALHRMLRALAEDDGCALVGALERLGTIGHSSGLDALAGAAAMLGGLARRDDPRGG